MNAATLSSADHRTAPSGAAALDPLDDPLEQARFTRWRPGPAGERLGESSLQLGGLHCAACAGPIEAALRGVPGVREAHVAATTQRASVLWDPQSTRPSALIAAVRAAGYDAVPEGSVATRALRRRESREALWRLFVAAFCAMQVMMLATPGYVAADGELSGDLRGLLNASSWLLTWPVLVFSCRPFFIGAWRGLRARRIGMDLPVALGVLITFVASTVATFAPGGPLGLDVYFDSLTMFVSLLLGARYVEMRLRHRTAEALEAQMAGLPQMAERIADDGSAQRINALHLAIGDRVRVALGEAFPADGVLLEGRTQCDESLLTGESLPVVKEAGAAVVAGSLNLGAPVLVRVQGVGPDTRLEAIVAMMRSAATQRPALARAADRFAAPFLWAVLLLAAGAAAVWSLFDPTRALWVAVSVLIVTCPCALSLATPATLLAATRAFARRGVVVQRLDAIESLARIEQIFFDKTGTLTTHVPTVSSTVLSDAGRRRLGSEAAARAAAAGLAAWSRHPLSQALVAAAAHDGGLSMIEGLGAPEEIPGLGVQAHDKQGRRWRLGLSAWVAADGSAMPSAQADGARVALAVDGAVLATFDFEESLREGAAEAIASLKAGGLRVTLLTGDNADRARALARRLAITDIVAAATPADKLAAVAAAQAAGRRVAMVGDGINDAPVLARADLSVAMGDGTAIARTQADAALVSGRLSDLVHARATARRALRIVHQNLAWAAGYNALCIPLALAGWLPPWAAGVGMATSSLIVVGNAMRAAR